MKIYNKGQRQVIFGDTIFREGSVTEVPKDQVALFEKLKLLQLADGDLVVVEDGKDASDYQGGAKESERNKALVERIKQLEEEAALAAEKAKAAAPAPAKSKA